MNVMFLALEESKTLIKLKLTGNSLYVGLPHSPFS